VKNLLVLILPVLLLCCAKPDVKQPPYGVIPEDTMVNVLMDLHVLQSELSLSSLPADSAQKVYLQLEEKVFLENKVTRKRFKTSYNYYMETINKMDELYARVVDSLALHEAEYLQKGH
jgi:hypothetical protein